MSDLNKEELNQPTKPTIDRRGFLRVSAGLAGAGLGLAVGRKIGLGVFNQEQQTNKENLLDELRKKVKDSQLPETSDDENAVSKERLFGFLDDAEKALDIFGQFHKEEEKLTEIHNLARKLYPNPDIQIEDQIFFLRDEKILKEGLAKLGSLEWKQPPVSLEADCSGVISTPAMMHSLSEESLAKESWYPSPEKIALLYSEVGIKKPTQVDFDTSALSTEGASINRVEEIKSWIKEVSRFLPLLHRVTVVLHAAKDDEKKPFWGHEVNNIPSGESTLELGVVSDKDIPFYKERVDWVTVHEATHSIDIQDNPGLVRYLSVAEILDLYILRLEAALDTDIPDSGRVLAPLQLRGQEVNGREIGNKFYDLWFVEESLRQSLTKDELETLFKLYPHDRWGFSGVLFLSDPIYELDKSRRSLTNLPNQTIYKNWEEFLTGEKQIIDVLSKKNLLLTFVINRVRQNLEVFDGLIGKQGGSGDFFWGRLLFANFRVIVAEDLLTKGEVKNYVSPQQYSDWLRRVPYEVRSTNQEKLADEIAFIVFLVYFRGKSFSEFKNKASIMYLAELSRIGPAHR